MTYGQAPRGASSRRDIPLKTDYPRGVDRWINYFGEPSQGCAPALPAGAPGIGSARVPAGGTSR
jgi:hypothetical protein